MSRRQPLPAHPVPARVESLEHDGRGVARVEGKVVFIDGALPGEDVTFRYTRRRGRFDEGAVVEVLAPAPERVAPRCPHFALCGGCSLQHLEPGHQVAVKQARLLEALEHAAGTGPGEVLPPLVGPPWGYRHKARLGVRYVRKKERLLVGFREKRSNRVADLTRCEVLHPAVGERISALREVLAGLAAAAAIPQVEVAVGDAGAVLVVRHLEPLGAGDRDALAAFAAATGLCLCLQPGGPDSVTALDGGPAPELAYALPDYGVRFGFRATDFTQVNPAINRAMVERALDLLAPAPGERVLDLYCGLGNFTLPLARRGARVTGVEGDPGLVDRARDNARAHGLEDVTYHVADLGRPDPAAPWLAGVYDKLLLDPPRSGALEVLQALPEAGPGRIVYVSCNPATLARDAGYLVRERGYRLVAAGVMDMFPHTSHVESMALFTAAE